jgi:hypothetical protein
MTRAIRTILSALLLGVAWAGSASAQSPQPSRVSCSGVMVPAWVTLARPSTPNDQTVGYNLTAGYCETYQAASGYWSPQTISSGSSGAFASLNVSGASTMAGIAASGGINTTATTGYSQNGATVFNNGPNANAPTLIGVGAGGSLTAGLLDTNGGFFAGYFSGSSFPVGSEATGVGNQTWRYATSVNSGDTGVGDGCGWHETTGTNLVCVSSDAMRDSAQLVSSIAIGRYSLSDWFGANSNVSVGAFSMMGNAAALTIAGTPTTGNTIPISFLDPNLNGGVTYTITYTVLSSDTTAAILATSLANFISADSSLAADGASAASDVARNPGVVRIAHPGNATIAGGNAGTFAVSVGTIGGGGSLAITETAGATGSGNTFTGAYAGEGYGASVAASNNGYGNGNMPALNSGSKNNLMAVGGGLFFKDASSNNGIGFNIYNGPNAVSIADNNVMGDSCGTKLSSVGGGLNGDLNIIIGDCQASSGGGWITTGKANVEIGAGAEAPSITGSFGSSYMNAMYGLVNNGTGSTVSTGCIGFYPAVFSAPCTAGQVDFGVGVGITGNLSVSAGIADFAQATTSRASINLSVSTTAPSAPNNADVWETSSGVFFQVNGGTITLPPGGVASKTCVASAATLTITNGLITATSGC